MRIPKQFNLFASTIHVEFNNEACKLKEAIGLANGDLKKIYLTTNSLGDELPDDTIEECFYHEKVHQILKAMDERDLDQNEKFVDTFSRLLRQSDLTTIY